MSEVLLTSFGVLWASALTCRLISLVCVQWSCLRINKPAFPHVGHGARRERDRSGGARRPESARRLKTAPLPYP